MGAGAIEQMGCRLKAKLKTVSVCIPLDTMSRINAIAVRRTVERGAPVTVSEVLRESVVHGLAALESELQALKGAK